MLEQIRTVRIIPPVAQGDVISNFTHQGLNNSVYSTSFVGLTSLDDSLLGNLGRVELADYYFDHLGQNQAATAPDLPLETPGADWLNLIKIERLRIGLDNAYHVLVPKPEDRLDIRYIVFDASNSNADAGTGVFSPDILEQFARIFHVSWGYMPYSEGYVKRDLPKGIDAFDPPAEYIKPRGLIFRREGQVHDVMSDFNSKYKKPDSEVGDFLSRHGYEQFWGQARVKRYFIECASHPNFNFSLAMNQGKIVAWFITYDMLPADALGEEVDVDARDGGSHVRLSTITKLETMGYVPEARDKKNRRLYLYHWATQGAHYHALLGSVSEDTNGIKAILTRVHKKAKHVIWAVKVVGFKETAVYSKDGNRCFYLHTSNNASNSLIFYIGGKGETDTSNTEA